MASFKFMGFPARPNLVVTYGPCKEYRVPHTDGTKHVLLPIEPATEFEIGVDMGHEITDVRMLRYMRADTKLEEIV